MKPQVQPKSHGPHGRHADHRRKLVDASRTIFSDIRWHTKLVSWGGFHSCSFEKVGGSSAAEAFPLIVQFVL